MDIWLPCIRFNIETVETRYSRPTELDFLLLEFIKVRIQRSGICHLSDVLEVFDVMDSTVLHGMLHKLHMRYLQLFPDGTVDLRDGLAAIIDEDYEEALTVQVGERNGSYAAYFDLFAGQVILDNRFTVAEETRIDGTQSLPTHYMPFDYERPELFSKQHYFALVNDQLRQRVVDDIQTDSYRVQTLRRLPEPDVGIQYLPLKVFKSGEHLQINSQDSIPTVALMKIAARVNRIQSQTSDRIPFTSRQLKSAPDDASAMQQQVNVWLRRALGTPPPSGSAVSLELRSWTDIGVLVSDVLTSPGDVVMDISLLRGAISKAPATVHAAVSEFLGRGGRLTVASAESALPGSLPLWRTTGTMKDFAQSERGKELFVEADGTAALRDIRSCRTHMGSLSAEQGKRFAKKLRQGREAQEIRYLVPKDSLVIPSRLQIIWTPAGVIIPLVSQKDEVVHGLYSPAEFELASDIHGTALEQCLEGLSPYFQRDNTEFRLTRSDVVEATSTSAARSQGIDGRIDVISEELFDAILTRVSKGETSSDVDIILNRGSARAPIAQDSKSRVHHRSGEAAGADVAIIAPKTIMVRLSGYALWISEVSATEIESLRNTLLGSEAPA